MSTLGLLLTLALGVYGAAKTYRIYAHGEHGQFIFTPVGAALYLSAAFFVFTGFLILERLNSGGAPLAAMPLAIVIPALLLPFGAYIGGLVVELGTRFFSTEASMGQVHSYDRGDAAMTRREFAAAARFYREDMARWPDDPEPVLRLARALESSGGGGGGAGAEEAARVLAGARRELLEGRGQNSGTERVAVGSPGFERRERGERMVAFTYALGDLYEGPLNRPEQAAELYEETLQLLYGFRDVGPVRERLARLKALAAQGPPAPALPDKISLD